MKINAFFYKKLTNFTLNVTIKSNAEKLITILGESGSGKSTLLNCISGLLKADKSYFKINDKIFQNSKKDIFIKPNKNKIGYVRQNVTLFSNLSVYENISISEKKQSTYVNKEHLLNILQVKKILNRKTNKLSGGERQRVLLCQILLMQPEILIFDEPLSSQDENIKKIIIRYIKNINTTFNIPIIWVSHNIEELYMLSNKIIYIDKGKLTYSNI